MHSFFERRILPVPAAVTTQIFLAQPKLLRMRWINLSPNFLGALSAVQEEQDRHANGQTVGYLFENYGPRAIRQFAVNFHPAVDRSRMHDQDIGLGVSEPRFV